ncbi:MAG: hypothetical protein NTV55_14010 [Planctomycetota bacterium]|nr:hypothetical protein [Planctomycetota bacterium]
MLQTKTMAGMALVVLGAAGLVGSSGCQTQIAGMTLPSPQYLEHAPQYVPPSPAFPLSRELAQQEEIASRPAPGAAPAGQPSR